MRFAMHTKHWGHGHNLEVFRHDCYVMFHSPAFWTMIVFLAIIALVFALAALFGGTNASLEGPLPVYPDMQWPVTPY